MPRIYLTWIVDGSMFESTPADHVRSGLLDELLRAQIAEAERGLIMAGSVTEADTYVQLSRFGEIAALLENALASQVGAGVLQVDLCTQL